MEGVEGVKKLLLSALASGQELNVIKDQDIDPAEPSLEFSHPFAPNRAYQFIHEGLGGHEQDPAAGGARAAEMMSDGGHQMSLAETDAAINKEGVVFFARSLGDRQRGGMGELVARPDDEFGKGEAGIQLRVEWPPLGFICAGSRCDGRCCNAFRRSIITTAAAVAVRTVVPA